MVPPAAVAVEPKKDKDGFKVPVRRIKRSKHNDEVIQRLGDKPEATKAGAFSVENSSEQSSSQHSPDPSADSATDPVQPAIQINSVVSQ
jgi:hypothetical protein